MNQETLNKELRLAAYNGQEGEVRRLLNKGADIDAQDSNGRTALHHAAISGHLYIVEMLIKAKASIDIQDSWGNTPLWEAVPCVNKAVISGNTPLYYALSTNSHEWAKILVKMGADQFARNQWGERPWETAHENIFHHMPTEWPDKDRGYIGDHGKLALCEGPGDPSKITQQGLLELCSAHRLGELFIQGQWQGREREALAYAKTLKDRLPPYWQDRFDAMVDLAPLRREAVSNAPDSAVARYLAGTLKPGGKGK